MHLKGLVQMPVVVLYPYLVKPFSTSTLSYVHMQLLGFQLVPVTNRPRQIGRRSSFPANLAESSINFPTNVHTLGK